MKNFWNYVKSNGLIMDSYLPKKVIPVIKKGLYKVKVINEEYTICVESSKGNNFWSNSKEGEYGQGLCKQDNDLFKPARMGKLGEMAFAKLFGIPLDISYREKGDKYDFLVNGVSIDVKTTGPKRKKGPGLVLRANEKGFEIPIGKDIYVFSYCAFDDTLWKQAEIVFVGWCTKKELLTFPVEKGILGSGHKNIVADFGKLHSMSELSSILKI